MLYMPNKYINSLCVLYLGEEQDLFSGVLCIENKTAMNK